MRLSQLPGPAQSSSLKKNVMHCINLIKQAPLSLFHLTQGVLSFVTRRQDYWPRQELCKQWRRPRKSRHRHRPCFSFFTDSLLSFSWSLVSCHIGCLKFLHGKGLQACKNTAVRVWKKHVMDIKFLTVPKTGVTEEAFVASKSKSHVDLCLYFGLKQCFWFCFISLSHLPLRPSMKWGLCIPCFSRTWLQRY